MATFCSGENLRRVLPSVVTGTSSKMVRYTIMRTQENVQFRLKHDTSYPPYASAATASAPSTQAIQVAAERRSR